MPATFTELLPCKHTEAAVTVIDNGWMRSDLVNPDVDTRNTEYPF